MPQYPPAAACSRDPDRDQDQQAGAFYAPQQLITALAGFATLIVIDVWVLCSVAIRAWGVAE